MDAHNETGRERITVELHGVSETLLWNLYQRSLEAARPDRRLLDDPRALELVERIDYPFEQFGGDGMAQWHALRVACLDAEVRRFLAGRWWPAAGPAVRRPRAATARRGGSGG